MPSRQAARRRTRVLLVLAVVAALLGVGWRSLAGPASSAASPVIGSAVGSAVGSVVGPAPHGHRIGTADGQVPDGVTVFDDRYPAVSRLDPALLHALRAAATAAARDGVRFVVNSGWRSRAYQEELFDQAVAQYGSAAQAARWVARPGTSVHEAGDAVDIGPDGAATWLARHGASYGLCQIYANEPWHYELRPGAVEPMYADPTEDPRMRS
jgi:hypothetical protein